DELPSRALRNGNGLRNSAYSASGRFVVTATEAGNACVWDTVSLKEVCPLPHLSQVTSAKFSPDDQSVVTSCYDGLARVWDMRPSQTNRLLLALKHSDA